MIITVVVNLKSFVDDLNVGADAVSFRVTLLSRVTEALFAFPRFFWCVLANIIKIIFAQEQMILLVYGT